MSRISRIEVPSPVIRRIPSPEVRQAPPPVVRGLAVPVVDIPDVVIEYPTVEIPSEPPIPGLAPPVQQPPPATEPENTRELGNTPAVEQPTIEVAGVEVPLPPVAPLVAAGATAIVVTSVTLTANIVLNKLKSAVLEPLLKRLSRRKKIKIKQVKPVLHYVLDDDGGIDIYQYSQKGTKLIHTTEDVERYLRDQVEIDSLYEYDNKIIIDEVIKDKFTKEGAKRFSSHFAPAKTVAKKLSAKFSI